MHFQSAIRVVGSHPSQEGAPGISVNSSPLMTVKAAGGTQLPELLALIAICHTFQGSSLGLIGDRLVLLSLIRERRFFLKFCLKCISCLNCLALVSNCISTRAVRVRAASCPYKTVHDG